jgi:hypothetical protein
VEQSELERVGGCSLDPGIQPGVEAQRQGGRCDSSQRWAAQPVGVFLHSRVLRTGAPPLLGRGRGVRRGRRVPRPRREGDCLAPPVPVPVRPAPLPDTH